MRDSKLTQWCNGLIEAGWLLAIILTPLFFNIHSSRVFEPDKLSLLRSIALMMILAWLVKFVDQAGWRDLGWLGWKSGSSIWRLPFALFVGLLALVYILSALFSVTPAISWLGSYQRLQGTYTTLSYIVVFALMGATLRNRLQLGRLVTTIIIVSIPISLYAMLQHFGLDPLPWGGNTQSRVAGHMGNAIFVAAYLIMVVPLTVARILDAFTNILQDEELAYPDIIRSSIYIFTLAIQIIAIYWTYSRGPFLGLAGGLFAFVLIVLVNLRNADPQKDTFRLLDGFKAMGLTLGGSAAIFLLFNALLSALTNSGRLLSLSGAMGSFTAFVGAIGAVTIAIFILMAAGKGWRWLWLSWLLVAAMLGVWLLAFNLVADIEEGETTNIVSQTLLEWRELPAIGRLGRMLESESGTGKVRVLIWEGALDLIAPHDPLQFPDGSDDALNFLRPLIGYGPESMYVAYNRFYLPELATVEARNASPDRSHNETLDALVITGAAGFIVWQLLYLSIFYFGFTWLGVVRSRRDQLTLIGMWTLGALVGGVVISSFLGFEFIGVAIPFGSIVGLALYLIYYALFAGNQEADTLIDPFSPDRLLLIGLVTAVMAHYIEIHFGIAIASTRTHFFVYVGLIFLVGYLLPKLGGSEFSEVVAEVEEKAADGDKKPQRKKRRGRGGRRRSSWGWLTPALTGGLILGVIIGTLGYDFITYNQPPGQQIQSLEDIPSAGDIFQQSMFIHSRRDFSESPYIFLTVIMSWALGSLLMLSEMAKEGFLPIDRAAGDLAEDKLKIIAGIFGAWAVAGLLIRLLGVNAQSGALGQLGGSLALIWAALTAWAAVGLLANFRSSKAVAGIVAGIGVATSIPLLIAGAVWVGLALALSCAFILTYFWNPLWERLTLPGLTLSLSGLGLGLAFAFAHASRIRSSFLAPPGAESMELTVRRIAEADRAAGILTLFYIFVIFVLLLIGTIAAWQKMGQERRSGGMPAYFASVVLFIVAIFAINRTNLRAIQADIIYKRGDPFERAANAAPPDQKPVMWDQVIAIYEHAVELAPTEDFYYLFLGRAYLEASAIQTDALRRDELLQTAEERLQTAQEINPLNTDHTANLARLNTRWADIAQAGERTAKIETAEKFYQDAMELSPQNAIIRNEYARLAYVFDRDCGESIDRYNASIGIDSYFIQSLFEKGEIQIACANGSEGEEQQAYFEGAVDSLKTGLELPITSRQKSTQDDPRRWLQLGQLYQQLGQTNEAIAAFEEALGLENNASPAWNTLLQIARAYNSLGDQSKAMERAAQALAVAPENNRATVQQFINELNGDSSSNQPSEATSDSPLPDPHSLADNSRILVESERTAAQLPASDRNGMYAGNGAALVADPAKNYEAVLTTEKGEIRILLYNKHTPLTVNNFIYLATQGFYDGIDFHRVLDNFMAQGGDPTGTGRGSPGYQFADEFVEGLTFDRPGLLAMANAGANTNGSQFFITYAPTPHLNERHTIFGEVVEGMDVVNSLTRRDPTAANQPDADRILRVDIYEIEE